MTVWRPLAGPVIAVAALAYLAAMIITGAQPVQRQLAAFEAKGVLKIPPERIRRVEISGTGERIILSRTGTSDWTTPDGSTLDAESGKRISTAVQMMHTSAPIRDIPPGELPQQDEASFGFSPPRITATFYEMGAVPIMTVRFGGNNPDEFLQYMRIDGNPDLYLMSRFVGEAWMQVLSRSLSQ